MWYQPSLRSGFFRFPISEYLMESRWRRFTNPKVRINDVELHVVSYSFLEYLFVYSSLTSCHEIDARISSSGKEIPKIIIAPLQPWDSPSDQRPFRLPLCLLVELNSPMPEVAWTSSRPFRAILTIRLIIQRGSSTLAQQKTYVYTWNIKPESLRTVSCWLLTSHQSILWSRK